ncbi:MAG: hypothetical protein LBS64_00125 [Spirochaetaceae bacterium]|jgi:hypothetical protein|nr:hypothetical protein [Spirochaetaceae bacterium]
MGNKKQFLLLVLVFSSVSVLWAQKASINMRFNVLKSETGKDYFIWSGEGRRYSDNFDVISGASKLQSTRELNTVVYDSGNVDGRPAFPLGLRGLLLFAVAPYETVMNDDLRIVADGSALTIRFVHRGTAYEIVTDKRGRINLADSCKMAGSLTDTVGEKHLLKPQYVKSGVDPEKMSSLDWSKIDLVPDTAASNAFRKYAGVLQAKYEEGILTVKGTVKFAE